MAAVSATTSTTKTSSEPTSTTFLATKLRKTNISIRKNDTFTSFSKSGSGFGAFGNTTNDKESCWSQAARKNRDKGIKTWQTFNILRPRQDAASPITKPAAPVPQQHMMKRLSKKQVLVHQRWVRGYHEATDKYGYLHGLRKVDEVGMEILGPNFAQVVTLERQVERAGEFVEWEGGVVGEWEDWDEVKDEWRENYDDENPFLSK